MPRTVPASSTQAPGNLITAALWNAGPAASNTFLTTPPFAVLVQTAAQTVTTSTLAPIAFDTTVVDPDGGHSNVTNNSRYTCQVAGWYLVIGSIAWATSATGNRITQLTKNGSNPLGGGSTTVAAAGAANNPSIQASFFFSLAVGDYVEVVGFQAAGGNLNTAANSSSMMVYFLHA